MSLTTLTVPPRRDAKRLADLPIVVIGAGPVGLAAAAELLERGLPVIVLEVGDTAASAVRSWGHTRLFTPWEFLVDDAAGRLLDKAGWDAPESSALPTGAQLIDQYLAPLTATPELRNRIRYGQKVVAVSRQGMDRTRSTGRADTPFVVRIQTAAGDTEQLARAVVDTSGTYSSPNSILASGLAPTDDVAALITHPLPDVLHADRAQFAGKHVVVVGSGHSAANTLMGLSSLVRSEPGTTISWVIRSADPTQLFGSTGDDLEARGALGDNVHDLVRQGVITLIDRFEIDTATRNGDGLRLAGRRAGEEFEVEADVVVNATGFRPDLQMHREIRLSLDEIVEAPRMLAPLIDPNLHSCGTVDPHGVVELMHPEPNFFIAGMKSYGRAPTFLLRTGYEQVRSIADDLAGNHQAARTVQLVLPDTGVCTTGPSGSTCCS